jgi:FKBP-type peptidyl-prolyl cis-trans isomerase 2
MAGGGSRCPQNIPMPGPLLPAEMVQMRWYIGLLLAAVLLFGCVNPPQPSNTTGPSVIGPQGNLSNQTVPAQAKDPNVADYGDHVWVDYTLRVDGKVFDTDNITLANESGIYNPMRDYGPLDFTLELNKGVIDGFVINIVGMRINETLRFIVDPQRGYGPVDKSKIIVIPRYYEKSLLEVVPKSYFDERNISTELGTGFDTKFGTVFIQNVSGDNITIYYMLEPGQKIMVSDIPTIVKDINSTEYMATMEFDLGVNKTYNLPNPETGAQTTYKVIDKTDQNITLDGNHPLAGKTLDFEVTLVKIEKAQ